MINWTLIPGQIINLRTSFKGRVSVITSEHSYKDCNAQFTPVPWNPWNLYLINNEENIVVFLGLKVFSSDDTLSCSRNTQVAFVENPQLKIISFSNYKNWYLFMLDQTMLLRVPLWIEYFHLYKGRVTWNFMNSEKMVKTPSRSSTTSLKLEPCGTQEYWLNYVIAVQLLLSLQYIWSISALLNSMFRVV